MTSFADLAPDREPLYQRRPAASAASEAPRAEGEDVTRITRSRRAQPPITAAHPNLVDLVQRLANELLQGSPLEPQTTERALGLFTKLTGSSQGRISGEMLGQIVHGALILLQPLELGAPLRPLGLGAPLDGVGGSGDLLGGSGANLRDAHEGASG
jgi:hypothetical protein